MTISQIAWAASHDWFLRDNGNGTVTVLEVSAYVGGPWEEKEVVFDNFRKLRIWAGY